ncbi:hypothetical protein [Ruegeria atlantica]|uniref:hypothetical protein n=1 Tax=Ruegeria atlantica TaxID=81569 RepID=UPI00147E61C6|nr:hypothetical protein [Ruegeria atlantica]
MDEHSVTVRMADNTIIEIRHDGSVKRRSSEDETRVEADDNTLLHMRHVANCVFLTFSARWQVAGERTKQSFETSI